jgi:hypothetical protein
MVYLNKHMKHTFQEGFELCFPVDFRKNLPPYSVPSIK